jgi:FKBP-type peptidyl-prolyl cis-trans isomerase FklB
MRSLLTGGSLSTAVLFAFGLTACSPPSGTTPEPAPAAPPTDAAGRVSYGLGYNTVSSLRDQLATDFDAAAFEAGVADAVAERAQTISDEDLAAARDEIMARRAQEAEASAEENLSEARAFLAENAGREGVVVTDSGLQYEVITEGDGATPTASDTVVTHYTGRLADGTVFDSSEARGEPATFGVDRVIVGWQEALQLMQVGDRWRIWLPPELAYGDRGAGDAIPPNAALVFEVELLAVNPTAE